MKTKPRGGVLRPLTASSRLFMALRADSLIRKVLTGRSTTLIRRLFWQLASLGSWSAKSRRPEAHALHPATWCFWDWGHLWDQCQWYHEGWRCQQGNVSIYFLHFFIITLIILIYHSDKLHDGLLVIHWWPYRLWSRVTCIWWMYVSVITAAHQGRQRGLRVPESFRWFY